jgi:PKD repeat protein
MSAYKKWGIRLLSVLTIALLFACDPLDTFNEVTNEPPVPDAGGDQIVLLGSTVFLDASKTADPENDGLTFQWNISSAPGGSTAVLSKSDIFFTSFVPDKIGFYTITLTVSDAYESVEDRIKIEVQDSGINTAPEVGFDLENTDTSGLENDLLTFSAIASDPDFGDSITNYEWDFGDGSPFESGASLSSVSHSYSSAGTYTVEVTVEDGNSETATASVEVVVSAAGVDPIPVAYFQPSLTEVNIAEGPVTVTFTDYSSNLVDNGGSEDVTYSWDFNGDTIEDSTVEGNTSFEYGTVGTYNAELRITDTAGRSDTHTVNIVVKKVSVLIPFADITLGSDEKLIDEKYVYTGLYGTKFPIAFAALVRFDLREVTVKKLVSATLYLDYKGYEGQVDRLTLDAYVINPQFNWDEAKAEPYEKLFSFEKSFASETLIRFGTYKLNVLEQVESWLSDPKSNNGFALEPVDQTPTEGLAQFAARDAKLPGIRLVLEYE